MIIMNIIQGDENSAREIANYLIKSKFATQVHIDTNILFNNEEEIKTIRLYFITKSLLYDLIESEMSTRFPKMKSVVYATPVTHINQLQAQFIKANIRAV